MALDELSLAVMRLLSSGRALTQGLLREQLIRAGHQSVTAAQVKSCVEGLAAGGFVTEASPGRWGAASSKDRPSSRPGKASRPKTDPLTAAPTMSLDLANPVPVVVAPEARAWTDEQSAVIKAPTAGLLLVEAGPGTGKTEVACARVAHLLTQGVPAPDILLISFTRAAIAELRKRIAALANEKDSARGVRIATVDSAAWELRVAADGYSGEHFAKGFDANISRLIELLKQKDETVVAALRSVQHLVVDEAQDLVGDRAELVLELISHLPATVGVTVFADPAQAIYGFTRDDHADESAPPPKPFIELFAKQYDGVARVALGKLFRTQERRLREVFERGRAVLFENAAADLRMNLVRELARKAGAPCREVEEDLPREGELVLYRRRVEVLLASSYLAGRNQAHRLRLGNTPLGLEPWVCCLFATEPSSTIAKADFDTLWMRHAGGPFFERTSRDDAWALLLRIAPTQNGTSLDLRKLRRTLARGRPPLELAQTEVGYGGPILGTIHASKGRESNEVRLYLPKPFDKNHDDEEEIEAEARVIYVGATRCRDKLAVGSGFAARGAQQLNDGRVFRNRVKPGKGPSAQVEFGLPEDVDALYGVLKGPRGDRGQARQIQDLIRTSAGKLVPLDAVQDGDAGDFAYRLHVEGKDELLVGALSSRVNADLFAIGDQVCGPNRTKPPRELRHLYLAGARGVVLAEDDAERPRVASPWAETGFYLAPVIRGFSVVYLQYRRR